MPQQKKQYEDTLGSIFDFIFEESQKSPGKVKPVKITGIDGTSEMVDALAAVLENPLLFVNNSTIEAFNDTLDIDLAKFEVGDRGGKIGLNVQNLRDAIEDPNSFIDKQFTKLENARKMQKATWAGEQMKSAMVYMWANKMGLDAKTKNALSVAARMSENYSTGKKVDISGRQTLDKGVSGMQSKGFSLDLARENSELMKKYFGPGHPRLTSADLISRFGPVKGANLFKKYQSADISFTNGTRDKLEELYFDTELFSILEGEEMISRENSAPSLAEKEKFQSARRFIDNMHTIQGMREYKDNAKRDILSYQNQIEILKQTPGPTNNRMITEHRRRIKDLQSGLNTMVGVELAGQLGKWEGMLSSMKGLVIDGNLVGSIINGDFFDYKRNKIPWLLPVQSMKLPTGRKIASFDYNNITKRYETKKDYEGIGFLAPKITGNRISDTYYGMATTLHYLSPVTWARSLINGEGFAFLNYRMRQKMEKEMGALIRAHIPSIDVEKLLNEIAEGNLTNHALLVGSLSTSQAALLKKFIGKDKFWRGLTHYFGSIARVKDRISDFFEKKVGRVIRDKIGQSLLKVAFINRFSTEAVKTWMSSGGMFTLVRGLVAGALQAVGLTIAGPLGQAIVSIVSNIATDIVYKISKPLLKFGLQTVVLIFAGLLGVLLLSGFWFMSIFGQYSNVSPQQVVQCGAFAGTDYIIDDPDNPGGLNPQGPMEPFVGGALPSGEQCLLGIGSFRCTQGPYGNFSHSRVAAIDLGGVNYFHAPAFCGNGGTCKITYVGDVNCSAGYAGGMVKFTAEYKGQTYEYKLIHVDTNLGNGQTLSSGQRVARVMEWSETGSKCSSGKHLHLETKLNGATVNPYDVMSKPVSQGGFACNISPC